VTGQRNRSIEGITHELSAQDRKFNAGKGIEGGVNNQWKRFVEKHIVADDPSPEYSNLDRDDGLPATLPNFLYPNYAEAQDPMPERISDRIPGSLPIGVLGSHAGLV